MDKHIDIKVSIIIPMYCAQDYVDSLLETFTNQDVQEIEILCIVDGSPDQTLQIVQEWTKKDSRVQVFTQEHKGAGAARNLGLARAQGEYVMFIDADDVYEPNYVSTLLKAVETTQADIGICYAKLEDAQTNVKWERFGHKGYFYPKNQAIPTSSISNLLTISNNATHNKIFRSRPIKENQCFFSETMSINDMVFTMCALICSSSIVLLDDCLYTIKKNRNEQSISTNRGKYTQDLIVAFSQLYDWLVEKDCFEKYKNDFYIKFSRSLKEYATTTNQDSFAQNVTYYLATKQPWANMDAKTLQKNSMLFVSKTQKRLEKETVPRFQMELTLIEENITKIQTILKEEYGIDVIRYDNLFSELLARIRLLKVQGIAMILYEKLRKDKR